VPPRGHRRRPLPGPPAGLTAERPGAADGLSRRPGSGPRPAGPAGRR